MKSWFRKIDMPLLILTILYIILGLIMVLSASSVSAVLRYHVYSYYFFIRQLIFTVISLVIGLVILKIPTSKYKFLSVIYTGVVLVLLCVVLIMGKVAGGAQSWLDIGFFNIQPTEFAKTALIIFMAVFYDKSVKKRKPFIYNFIPIIIGIIMFGLIAKQPDLGGAIIVAGIVFFTFLAVPFEKTNKVRVVKYLGFAVLLGTVILLYSGSEIFNSSQLRRLQFQSPCNRYMEDTGYQVCNGYIAFHNGGLFGRGLGNSTQKYLYLPESHTDFVFPILVEELGLIVGILVLIGYVAILYRILRIAKKADSVRNSVLCYGTFIFFLLHLLVNLLGILALIPLTGVPLPFLSYGGSFTLNVVAMTFVVQRVNMETIHNQEKKAIQNL